jgi:hypothetical protein
MQTYSQSKFLLECLGGGEVKSSLSIVGYLCPRVEISTNGYRTYVKMSISSSIASM